jgi:thioredoxin-like negative regulator of GroEL
MACWILSALMCAVVGADPECAILHFTADWCEPCKQIEPSLTLLQGEGWVIHTVNVDHQPNLIKQYRIENLPTLVILCRQQEVDRMVGAATYERIHERVQRAAARNQNGAGARLQEPLELQEPAPIQTSPPKSPVVRGQSPGLTGFPLLATAGHIGATHRSTAEAATISEPLMAAEQSPATQQAPVMQQASATHQALSAEQAIARAAAATVRIRVDEANTTAYGTGTIVDVRGQEALILTCGHLFRDMQPNSQLTIDLFPGTAQEVNLPSELVDFKAEDEDIGLISFRLPIAVAPVPILARGEQLAVGQPAFSFGCDRGANPTRRDTKIKSINRYLGADNIEIAGAPVLGRSGGGLFDMQGRLIGVCNAANPEDDEGIYAAADVVYNQIERLGLSELFEGSRPTTSPHDEVQLASATSQSASPQGWQPPSSSTVGVPAPGDSAAATPTESLSWPDQNAKIPNVNAPLTLSNSLAGQGGAGGELPVLASNTRQIICIVRDTGGQDRVLTIDAPPDQLLQMLQQTALSRSPTSR